MPHKGSKPYKGSGAGAKIKSSSKGRGTAKIKTTPRPPRVGKHTTRSGLRSGKR